MSQGSLIVEEYYKEMEMALVRVNIEEDTKAVHDGFTNKISLFHYIVPELLIQFSVSLSR